MKTRRALLGSGLLSGAALAVPGFAKAQRWIPQKPSSRVIVDNDFAGDPDGLFALIHQLLTPKTRVSLVTSTALDPNFSKEQFPKGGTSAAGREIALELIRRAKIRNAPPVIAGVEDFSLAASIAARAIVAEAMRDDRLPLFLACGGPLTNVAAALKLEPSIAGRMTLIWIGGGNYPAGGWEYNLAVDGAAARHVIEESAIPIWQVPQGTYRQMQYSIAELRADMQPISPLTRWLYDRFTTPPSFVELGATWPMGDSPSVLLTALSIESSRYVDRPALRIGKDFNYGAAIPNRSIRVFETIDTRLIFSDFLALLRLHASGR